LPAAYKHKVVAIEEIQTMVNETRDMVIGKLSNFELSEFGESLPKTKSAFKATILKKDKQGYDLGESSSRKMFSMSRK